MLKNAKKALILRCFGDVSTHLAMFAHVSNTVFTPKPRSFYAKQTQNKPNQTQFQNPPHFLPLFPAG